MVDRAWRMIRWPVLLRFEVTEERPARPSSTHSPHHLNNESGQRHRDEARFFSTIGTKWQMLAANSRSALGKPHAGAGIRIRTTYY
jgi:hypothetical protein